MTPAPVGQPEPLLVRAVLAFKANRRWFGGAGLAVFGPMLFHPVVQASPTRMLVVGAITNLSSYLAGAGSHDSDREQKERQARRRAARLAGLR
jgi:hypothetical protein